MKFKGRRRGHTKKETRNIYSFFMGLDYLGKVELDMRTIFI
jgi:hypothetical protein